MNNSMKIKDIKPINYAQQKKRVAKLREPKKQAQRVFKEIQGYNKNQLDEMIRELRKIANEQCVIGERNESPM